MSFDQILQLLVEDLGGLPALVIVALGWQIVRVQRRNDALTDKLFEISRTQSEAMNELARQIEMSTRA